VESPFRSFPVVPRRIGQWPLFKHDVCSFATAGARGEEQPATRTPRGRDRPGPRCATPAPATKVGTDEIFRDSKTRFRFTDGGFLFNKQAGHAETKPAEGPLELFHFPTSHRYNGARG